MLVNPPFASVCGVFLFQHFEEAVRVCYRHLAGEISTDIGRGFTLQRSYVFHKRQSFSKIFLVVTSIGQQEESRPGESTLNDAQQGLGILRPWLAGNYYLGWLGVELLPGGEHKWQGRWIVVDDLTERFHEASRHSLPFGLILQLGKPQEVMRSHRVCGRFSAIVTAPHPDLDRGILRTVEEKSFFYVPELLNLSFGQFLGPLEPFWIVICLVQIKQAVHQIAIVLSLIHI